MRKKSHQMISFILHWLIRIYFFDETGSTNLNNVAVVDDEVSKHHSQITFAHRVLSWVRFNVLVKEKNEWLLEFFIFCWCISLLDSTILKSVFFRVWWRRRSDKSDFHFSESKYWLPTNSDNNLFVIEYTVKFTIAERMST